MLGRVGSSSLHFPHMRCCSPNWQRCASCFNRDRC
jgi:hypothetical protein